MVLSCFGNLGGPFEGTAMSNLGSWFLLPWSLRFKPFGFSSRVAATVQGNDFQRGGCSVAECPNHPLRVYGDRWQRCRYQLTCKRHALPFGIREKSALPVTFALLELCLVGFAYCLLCFLLTIAWPVAICGWLLAAGCCLLFSACWVLVVIC